MAQEISYLELLGLAAKGVMHTRTWVSPVPVDPVVARVARSVTFEPDGTLTWNLQGQREDVEYVVEKLRAAGYLAIQEEQGREVG